MLDAEVLQVPDEIVDVRRVRGVAHLVGAEVLGVADEVDRERAELALAVGSQGLRGERGDGAGVQATGQQRAQRDVGDQLAFDDVVQQPANGADGGLQVVGVLAGLQPPVAVLGHSVPAHRDDAARAHLVHSPVDRAFRGLDEGEQLPEPIGVDHGRPGQRVGEDRLGLGAEQHARRGRVVVERLDPEPVAHEHQLVLPHVPDAEGVHAVQAAAEIGPPFEIGVQDDLGVAAGAEPVTARGELVAQLLEVVHLTAVGQDGEHLAVLLGDHGLAPALDVDDREPPVPQRPVRRDPHPLVVRPPAGHGLRHVPQRVP